MEETLTRKIKIYCPQHQTTFETTDDAKIVCDVKEHALSNDFPRGEFWEYCCDCRTFSPSDLEVGGKVKDVCPRCERQTVSRFVCGDCKTVSFDSGENTKGKIFSIDFDEKTIAPACAGCLKDFTNKNLQVHKCDEAKGVFLTSRENCPFCKRELIQAKKKSAVIPAETTKLAANKKKSGIICPACGAMREPDSVFCSNCGQSMKGVAPPPPIPPPIPVATAENITTPLAAKTSGGAGQGLTAVGIILALVVACCICGKLQTDKKNYESSYPTTDYKTPNAIYENKPLISNLTVNNANSGNLNKTVTNTAKVNKVQPKKRVKNVNANINANLSDSPFEDEIIETNANFQNVSPKSTPPKVNSMPNVKPTAMPAANRDRKIIIQ